MEFLNNHRVRIILNKEAVKVAHIGTSRLTPFLNGETTIISERGFPEHFEKFPKGVLRSVEVLPIGSDIIEGNELTGTAIEVSFDFFADHYKTHLLFHYSDYASNSHQHKATQSDLQIDDNKCVFICNYRRNTIGEAKRYATLEQASSTNQSGTSFLESTDPFASHFYLLHHHEVLTAAGSSLLPFVVNDGREVAIAPSGLVSNRIHTENDWFDLSIKVRQDDSLFDFKNLTKNTREGDPIYPLSSDKIFVISQEWLNKFQSITEYTRV